METLIVNPNVSHSHADAASTSAYSSSGITLHFGIDRFFRILSSAQTNLGHNSMLLRVHSHSHIGEDIFMELLVYSANWCRDCREAKRFLTRHEIPFTEIDIERTPGAADQVIANTGKRAIPQFVLDGKWIQPYRPGYGFLHEEMSELFGVSE
jgi:glutaredoxin